MRTVKLAMVCALAWLATGCAGPVGNPGLYWNGMITVTADFENVAGLYEGNVVAVMGVPVGRIDSIDARGAFVTVTMSIDRRVDVPADAVAATVSPQLITNRHVELTPPYTGAGPTLTDGDHIPLERTRTPVELDRILASFDQLGDALKGDDRDGPMASRVLFPLLDGNGDKLKQTLDALSTAFEVTNANRDQIANTVVRLNDITELLARNDTTVRDFSGRLTELVAMMADQAPGLQAVLTQLNDFVRNTTAVVAENKQPLVAALTRLTGITDQMRRNARNLTEVVDIAPLLFDNLDNSVSREHQAVRVHALTDKSVLDGEMLALFCERIQLRADGCRTGRPQDFGPDLGLTEALLGLTR